MKKTTETDVIQILEWNVGLNRKIQADPDLKTVGLYLKADEVLAIVEYIRALEERVGVANRQIKERERGENFICNGKCTASDWKPGGKCDLNGCYHE